MSTTIVNVNGKSTLLSYVLLFFVGYLGIHKFYLRSPFSGIAYLSLFLVGDLLWLIGMGWILHIPLSILMIIDIFIIPGRVSKLNNRDVNRILRDANA